MAGFCSFLAGIIGFYSFIIIVRIILSWIVMYSYQNGRRSGYGGYGYTDPQAQPSGVEKASEALGKIVDPYLKVFSKVKSLKRSNLDFTPILALIVLNIAKSLFSMIAQTGRVSVGVLFALIVESLWGSLLSFIFLIIIILLVARLIAGKRNSYKAEAWINTIDPILNGPVGFVYKLFFKKSKNSNENKLVVASLIFYLVCYVLIGSLCDYLVEILLRL